MSSTALTLQLVILSGLPQPTGAVMLINTSGTDVGVWRTGNGWGDGVLSFDLLWEGRVRRIVRREQEYTRNVPSSFVLPAGARHEWPFDLGDGTWDTPASFGPPARLVAVYDVPASPEAASHAVWTGQVRSGPVAWAGSVPDPRRPD